MFSIKFECGPAVDEYYMYSARSYCVQKVNYINNKDGTRVVTENQPRMCINIWPGRGDDSFDIFVESGQIVYVMNASGQTVDIIRGLRQQCCKRDHNHDGNCDHHPTEN
jgi:hypothetical protein